jgi:hypothetical protein
MCGSMVIHGKHGKKNLAIGSFHGKTLYKCWTMPVSSWEYQPEISRNDELSSWPTSLPGFPS